MTAQIFFSHLGPKRNGKEKRRNKVNFYNPQLTEMLLQSLPPSAAFSLGFFKFSLELKAAEYCMSIVSSNSIIDKNGCGDFFLG